MTQNDKELLLKDLCARLPYNVKVKVECGDIPYGPTVLSKLDIKRRVALFDFEVRIENCKPYLRPMSSMTEEEKNDYLNTFKKSIIGTDEEDGRVWTVDSIEWLNAHHFDYRGLIEKGLAIAVAKDNNPYHG